MRNRSVRNHLAEPVQTASAELKCYDLSIFTGGSLSNEEVFVCRLGLLAITQCHCTDARRRIEGPWPPRRNQKDAARSSRAADGTYDTLKKGTGQLVCYDRSNELGRTGFNVQCTVLGNLPRVAQNRKFEAISDKAARQAAIDAAEKDGTRVKPVYGSPWIDMNGADKEHARIHRTIAIPGATTASTGLPTDGKAGGAWIMDAGTTTAHIMIPGT